MKLKYTLKRSAITLFISLLFVSCGEAQYKMKLPFVAYNMLLQTSLEISNSDNEYIEFLERSFGMSENEIKDVFDYLRTVKSESELKKSVTVEVYRSLRQLDEVSKKSRKEYFVNNILAPYLTLVVNRSYLGSDTETEICKKFEEIFGVTDFNNALQRLVEATENYYNGVPYSIDNLHLMNAVLQYNGYFLNYDLDSKYANIYRISKYLASNIQWGNANEITIIQIKRIYPNVLPPAKGYSTIGTNVVVVVEDYFPMLVDVYRKELKSMHPEDEYMDFKYQKIWESIGLEIRLEDANRIMYELSKIDFENIEDEQIELYLITQTAIHEAKHKVDEYDNPRQLLSLDNEVSAHLTEAIYSGSPHDALRSAIQRIEGYYINTRNEKLGYLLKQLWNLASAHVKLSNPNNDLLRKELFEIYTGYRTIQHSEALIDLSKFEKILVPEIWKNIK